jgi:hypothetical protein
MKLERQPDLFYLNEQRRLIHLFGLGLIGAIIQKEIIQHLCMRLA